MRAFLISSRAWVKLVKERTTPSITSESILNDVASPKKFASTLPAAPLMQEWPEGYSGCGGVTSSGVQASASVPALPSVAANGIAVTGRQKTYSYFASKQPIRASAMAMFTKASKRLDSDNVRWRSAASATATWLKE